MPELDDVDGIKNYKVKPERFFGHVIGHEGRGSLLSALKREGL